MHDFLIDPDIRVAYDILFHFIFFSSRPFATLWAHKKAYFDLNRRPGSDNGFYCPDVLIMKLKEKKIYWKAVI